MLERHRRELGEFLRAKRDRLQPEGVGLPKGTRRRAPGLRREEVALLADVSTAWYTWLEQGRDVRPSSRTMRRVLDALHLNQEERAYVEGLLGATLALSDDVPSPVLQHVLDACHPAPALLLDHHWNCLTMNDASRRLGLLGRPGGTINILDLMFRTGEIRNSIRNWEEQARELVGALRLESSRYPEDEWFAEQVEDLSAASADFRRFWVEQEVRGHAASRTVFRHPELGDLELNATWLQVIGAARIKVLVYTPDPGSRTARALQTWV